MTEPRVHPRTLIRKAIVAALLQRTAAEDRVVANRTAPWEGGQQLPAIAVYMMQERSRPDGSAPRGRKERTVRLAVQATLQYTQDGLDDAIDAMALQIEDAMDADETFGELADECVLSGSDLEFPMGGRPTAVLLLEYTVTYVTEPRPLDTDDLKDFIRADIRTSLDNAQAVAEQAHDVVDRLDA